MDILTAITDSTCGEACWQAREDVCRCSCAGKNHGCRKGKDGTRPIRTSKINGEMHELRAVGYGELNEVAQVINEAAGITFRYAHTARDPISQGPAKLRPASESQVRRWEELASYRHLIPAAWIAANPGKCWAKWPGLPYLLWVRLEPTTRNR